MISQIKFFEVALKLIHFEIQIEQMLKVLYDFDAEAGTELTVKEGDVLTILSKDAGDGWWNARLVFTFIRVNPIGRCPLHRIKRSRKIIKGWGIRGSGIRGHLRVPSLAHFSPFIYGTLK